MYCVIQEIELKKENQYGGYKELKAYESRFTMYNEEHVKYSYDYTGGRFKRPMKKAYKISIHHSYREKGKVKKKQWVICTMEYYDIAQGTTYIGDYFISSKWEEKLKSIGVSEDELYDLVYKKLDPLIEHIQNEFHKTEEYKTHQEHEAIINKYLKDKGAFESVYGDNTYDYCYDVFGQVRNEKKLQEIKEQYKQQREYRRSYYENYKSNYNDYFKGSYHENKVSTYTEEEKSYLKKIYKAAAMKLHPDTAKDNGEGMKFLNNLKEKWGI